MPFQVSRFCPPTLALAADYRKVWPFSTKRLATSTSAGYKLCLIQEFVLGLEKRH